MPDWLESIPQIDQALAVAVAVAALAALAFAGRGGHYRALPGWLGFWFVLAPLLVCLSRLSPRVSLTLLGLFMFAGLRSYFFQVPLRPQDRLAMVAAVLTIPLALYPGFTGSSEAFLATLPVVVFLVLPALAAIHRNQNGFLDSAGRLMLGVLLHVFCAAHLGLLVRGGAGVLELFGILVIAAELPQRLVGRAGQVPMSRAAIGVVLAVVCAGAAGYFVGPLAGVGDEDAARAGVLVVLAVFLAALVAEATARDLGQGASASRMGRGAFLDRAIPALYAAPVYFHYLNYYA